MDEVFVKKRNNNKPESIIAIGGFTLNVSYHEHSDGNGLDRKLIIVICICFLLMVLSMSVELG